MSFTYYLTDFHVTSFTERSNDHQKREDPLLCLLDLCRRRYYPPRRSLKINPSLQILTKAASLSFGYMMVKNIQCDVSASMYWACWHIVQSDSTINSRVVIYGSHHPISMFNEAKQANSFNISRANKFATLSMQFILREACHSEPYTISRHMAQ